MIIIGDGISNSLFEWGNRPASEQHFDHFRRDKLQLTVSDFEIEARDSWRSPPFWRLLPGELGRAPNPAGFNAGDQPTFVGSGNKPLLPLLGGSGEGQRF